MLVKYIGEVVPVVPKRRARPYNTTRGLSCIHLTTVSSSGDRGPSSDCSCRAAQMLDFAASSNVIQATKSLSQPCVWRAGKLQPARPR